RGLADDAGVAVAAADVGEAADVAQHLAEQLGPLPGDGEGADAAGADAADRPAGGVLLQVDLLADLGEDLLFEEPGVLVRQRVVLEAPVLEVRLHPLAALQVAAARVDE